MHKTKNEINEYQKTKYHSRKRKAKAEKFVLVAIIIALLVAFFLYASDVKGTNEDTAGSIQGVRDELRKLREDVKAQFDATGQKLLDQDKKIDGVKQSKAEEKKAATLVQNKRPTVSGNCGSEITKYDWPHDLAYKVLLQESGGNPGRINNNPATKDYSVGCFQVNLYGAMRYTRPAEAWLLSATNNVSYAYQIYLGQGRTFCTKGGWFNTCKKLNLI